MQIIPIHVSSTKFIVPVHQARRSEALLQVALCSPAMSCGAFVSLSDNSRGTLPSTVASPKFNDNKIQLASLNGQSRGCTAPCRSGRLLQASGSPRGEIGRCAVLEHRGPVLLRAVSRLRSRPPHPAGRRQRARAVRPDEGGPGATPPHRGLAGAGLCQRGLLCVYCRV